MNCQNKNFYGSLASLKWCPNKHPAAHNFGAMAYITQQCVGKY